MSTLKPLHIGMTLAPTWLNGAGWRRPDSQVEGIFSAAFHVDIARRAEAAKLDFVFRPDTLFLNTPALEQGSAFAALDPTVLLTAVAQETTRIGLLSTMSTTFYPPYVVARQIQSLNWLSNGRAGWNIVTALEGHANFGLASMPSADERYAQAAEFTDVVRALWGSYPRSALLTDRATGRHGDPARVHPIDHEGRFFQVKGPLNLPAFSDAPIPLVQAGASPAGRAFAASVADAVFISAPDREAALEVRSDLRRRAEAAGRKAGDIRILPGLSLYLAPSRAEAQALFAETHAGADIARKLAIICEMTGLDLSDWPDDRPISATDLPPPPERVRSRTHSDLLRRAILRETPTRADLFLRPEVAGSGHWQIIGTVEDALAEIRAWAEAGAIDGFIATPGGSVDCMHLVLDDLVPRLTEAGLFRKDYTGTTFFEHLQG
ncbi:hypothetical protein GCM10007301_06910 [Azorhizobium oxalatiphilum]|uniref:Luciferase-like domain-containing protein n=1 Tax=Azorhizobium oxalatiphilum TaxID=980631 RepID=A0A917BM82_9HYPH|nr:NtaA/DmoA family FMN-dependent monooxygenase [Azorhizobium oxalatiphilum]GGF50209.1 hypothetical protein GCM10007301_06910 [Azorhizobium oxalatiphilum]